MKKFSIKRRWQKIKRAFNLFINKKIKRAEYTNEILMNPWVSVEKYTYGEPEILIFSNDPASTAKIYIGKFCSIALNVEIFTGGNHNINWVTTYPFNHFTKDFPEGRKVVGYPSTKGNVHIGNDVWIGRGATIMSGVTIGDGAVIGAYCVVASDVEPYEIVIGSPMKRLKKRFSDETIKKLLHIKWWNWEKEKINNEVLNLCSTNIEEFVNKHY